MAQNVSSKHRVGQMAFGALKWINSSLTPPTRSKKRFKNPGMVEAHPQNHPFSKTPGKTQNKLTIALQMWRYPQEKSGGNRQTQSFYAPSSAVKPAFSWICPFTLPESLESSGSLYQALGKAQNRIGGAFPNRLAYLFGSPWGRHLPIVMTSRYTQMEVWKSFFTFSTGCFLGSMLIFKNMYFWSEISESIRVTVNSKPHCSIVVYKLWTCHTTKAHWELGESSGE